MRCTIERNHGIQILRSFNRQKHLGMFTSSPFLRSSIYNNNYHAMYLNSICNKSQMIFSRSFKRGRFREEEDYDFGDAGARYIDDDDDFGSSRKRSSSKLGRKSFDSYPKNSDFNGYDNDPPKSTPRSKLGRRFGQEEGAEEYGNQREYNDSDFKLKDWDWSTFLSKLPPIVPFNYEPAPELAKLSEKEIQKIREKSNPPIFVAGKGVPCPISSFDQLKLPEALANLLKQMEFKPTGIQAQAIPIALSNKDLVGIAETGSGKTLGYILPAILHILNQPYASSIRSIPKNPRALILAPTRELAQQITREAQQFASPLRLAVQSFYGGVSRMSSLTQLRRDGVPDIAVGTPGRLLDLISAGELRVDGVLYFVVDEADRMLDMGFAPQLKQIVSQLRPDRQTLMWSATWPTEVQELAQQFLKKDKELVSVGADPLMKQTLSANAAVRQEFSIIKGHQRMPKLFEILESIEAGVYLNAPSGKVNKDNKDKPSTDKNDNNEAAAAAPPATVEEDTIRVLIFGQTRTDVEKISFELTNKGYPVSSIHGGKTQAQRDHSLMSFRKGINPILVATDVAARGLDIKDVKYVINYNFPNSVEDYIHRIGRTGRAGAKGVSITLLNPLVDSKYVNDVVKVMKQAKQEPSSELLQLQRTSFSATSSRGNFTMRSFSAKSVMPERQFRDLRHGQRNYEHLQQRNQRLNADGFNDNNTNNNNNNNNKRNTRPSAASGSGKTMSEIDHLFSTLFDNKK